MQVAGRLRDRRCEGDHCRRPEAELLASAHRRSLHVAADLGARTVAFPAISCGIYGYPPELAGPVAVGAVAEQLDRFELVRFVFRDDSLRAAFAASAEALSL